MKQQLKSLWNLIKLHPLYAVIVLGTLVGVIFALSGWIGGTIEHWKQNRFDKKQAEYERQIGDLKQERDTLIKRANQAEANALLKEAEAKELKDLIDQKGGAIQKAANEMEKQIEIAKQGAGDCQALTDPNARTTCLCDKLKSAGFECN